MKNKFLVFVGIALMLWGFVAFLASISIFIEEKKDAGTVAGLLLFISIIAFLPLFFGYKLIKRHFKQLVSANKPSLDETTDEGLEKLLDQYFKPVALKVPEGKSISLSNDGKDLLTKITQSQERRSINCAFFIEYRDANGMLSKRRVTVLNIVPAMGDSDFYLECHCHERVATRTFKLSRVQGMVDIETGEVIVDKYSFFYERYYQMNEDPVQQILEEKESEALILIFIARADGILRKKELEVIADYLMNDCPNQIDNDELIKALRKMHCLMNEFRKHLRKVNTTLTEDAKELLLKCINDVIYADKKADPLELAGLELMKKIFGVKEVARHL